MPLRRSILATIMASIAAGAPLGLQAQDRYYTPPGQYCPPGYNTSPPGIVYLPGTSFPQYAPGYPSAPGQTPQGQSPLPQGPNQPAAPGQPPAPTQQPQMANPTFMPSQPTTAATSPASATPNMIGDLFGTGGTQTVVITPDPVSFLPASSVVPFAVTDLAISFVPYGLTMPTSVAPDVVFITGGDTFMGTDFTTGNPVAQSIGSSTFTSQLSTATINGGVPLAEHVGPAPDILTNPSAPGTSFTLDDGTIPYKADVTDFVTATKPGLAAQQTAYVGVNGPGTFSGQAGESVTFQDAEATLATDNGATGPDTATQIETIDEFYLQQEVNYDPGTLIFQPDAVLIPVPSILLELPALGGLPGANVGRQKLTENSSPIPQDRVFVNYSFFSDTPLRPDGVDVNRITPGFETTFLNGLMSLEVRVPFASTLSSDLVAGGMGNTNETELGNLTMYWKTLLWRDRTKAISAGVGVALPSASDVEISTADGTPLLKVKNDAVHALPFVGGIWTPTPRTFVQGICQFDIDTRGNPVLLSSFDQGLATGNLQQAGRPNDADYVFYDVSVGYWIYQNNSGRGFLKGFAPMVELHYNQTINQADSVSANVDGANILLNSNQDTNLLNGLVGATAVLNHNATVTVAYVTPLGNSDKQFEGELRIFVNWLFGGTNGGFQGLVF